jgi:hypothetical protein
MCDFVLYSGEKEARRLQPIQNQDILFQKLRIPADSTPTFANLKNMYSSL